jgi:hypothetical protein
VQAFFGGLALNRSIKALRIILEYPDVYDDDYIPVTKTIFEALLPWFRFNDNLQVFDLECGIKDAILVYSSLKSIQLNCKQTDWEKETRSILAKRQIQHLLLTGGFLSRDACAHIKSLLLDKRCALRSLTLEIFLHDDGLNDLEEIINALSNNRSIRYLCLDLKERSCARHVIDLLGKKQFSTIEKLRLSCYNIMINKCAPLHSFGHQMPNLKSLLISGLDFDSVVQGTNYNVETGLTSSLRELSMPQLSSNDLNELSSYISGNSSLRVLDLYGERVSSALRGLAFSTVFEMQSTWNQSNSI